MKLLLKTTLLISFLMSSISSQATHTFGGELSWKCLENGKYEFFMTFYRDCSGIQWQYKDETIQIIGSPLPKDSSGIILSNFLVHPDSVRWNILKQGDTSPSCSDLYGDTVSCYSGDNGVMQTFWYKSKPLTINGTPPFGTPPSDGWTFLWTASCCRPSNLENVNTTLAGIDNSVVLRSTMLRTFNNEDVNPCIDSSPEFMASPVSLICRRSEYSLNGIAIDEDLDSLSYQFSFAINPPNNQGSNMVPFKSGYSINNPTPDTSFDSRNIPLTIDSLSGFMNLAVYSGTGVKKYLTVIEATSWREGVPISRIYRELPLSVFDCPKMPSGFVNNPPSIRFNGLNEQDFKLEVNAGEEIKIPIEIKDLDQTGVGTQLQEVTLIPDGLMFTRDRNFGSPCSNSDSVVEPCAYLRNQNPFLDKNEDPAVYKIQGLGGISTEFVWQTDCNHIKIKKGKTGTRSATYNFVMRVTDDHCPIPSINYPTVSVIVNEPKILNEPIVKGISVGLDGKITYQWVPPIDSIKTFKKYIVDYATVNEGLKPSSWLTINDSLEKYQFDQKYSDNPSIYQSIGNNPANGADLFLLNNGNSGNGLDWYIRMTAVSGCEDTSKSAPSDAVRVIELDTKAAGTFPAPLKGGVDLTWNRAKTINSDTKPYFKYESPTWYYIWENDSVGKTGEELQETADASNWYVRGRTKGTSFNAQSNVCGEFVGFRIEARDTVITFKQGYGLNSDSLDTLFFSTFSTVDTIYQVKAGFIPEPNFDTIQVLDNGGVFVNFDVANSGTIGEIKLYKDDIIPRNEIVSLKKGPITSYTINAAGATAGTAVSNGSGVPGVINTYVIKAIDACDNSKTSDGPKYTTISPYGELSSLCPPKFTLNWNKPTGFPNGVSYYKIYENGQQISTIINQNITSIDLSVAKGESVDYEIIAVSISNVGIPAVNISAKLSYTVPSNLRSDEIVPGPDLRCSFVEESGSVTLTFEHPFDSTDNRTEYEFQYKPSGSGAWLDFTNSSMVNVYSDSTILIDGARINAQNEGYDFRAKTLSGCSGAEPGPYGKTISSLFLSVTPRQGDAQKRGDAEWNDGGYSQFYPSFIHKYGRNTSYQYFPIGSLFDTLFTDNLNHAICDSTFNYHLIKKEDILFNPGQTCIIRSNFTFASYIDTLEPGPPPPNNSFLTVRNDTILQATFYHPKDSFIWIKVIGYASGLIKYDVIAKTAEPFYTPGDTGQYGLQLEDACRNRSVVSNLIGIYPVGISEISFKDQFSLYPNPTNGKVQIINEAKFSQLNIQVRNIHGQLTQEKQFLNQQQFDIELKGEAGIYFIQLINEKGEKANLKVIKQ